MKKKSGFTLIELMIVVAIIAIIAAIAIPNLLRSRMSANEASAAGGIRTISTGETSYQAAGIEIDATTGTGQYGDIDELGSGNTPFIDSALSSGAKSGYIFEVTEQDDAAAPTFSATATPASDNSGIKQYFVDTSGVIRFTGDGTAVDESSNPLN